MDWFKGNIGFNKVFARITSFVISACILFMLMPEVSADMTFSDVDSGKWYYTAVSWCYDNEYVSGYSDNTFKPNNTITRAEFAAIINKVAQANGTVTEDADIPSSTGIFTDVNQNAWYAQFVANCVNYNLMTGYSSTTFGVQDKLTREQAALIICRAFNIDCVDGYISYSDSSDVATWAYMSVYTCTVLGLMSGYEDGSFRPKNNITRAEIAQIIYSSFQKKDKIEAFNEDPSSYSQKHVTSVNHRGYATVAPENTLPAFRMSKEMGYDAVETDISLTADRIPVLLHDDTINRTARNTDGSEIEESLKISELTLEQARSYDYGISTGAEYAGTEIPTLEEFLSLCKELDLGAYIELKTTAVYTNDDIRYFMTLADKYEMTDKVTWISFSYDLLEMVKEEDPSARIGYLTKKVNLSYITKAKKLKTSENTVFVDSDDTSASAIALCKAASLPMELWVVDDASTVKNMDPYITGITSNTLIADKVLYG